MTQHRAGFFGLGFRLSSRSSHPLLLLNISSSQKFSYKSGRRVVDSHSEHCNASLRWKHWKNGVFLLFLTPEVAYCEARLSTPSFTTQICAKVAFNPTK
jgi:hypothetical protein